ncbi:MAG TPA: PVC-type heme-binding CxxCH protein [Planctomycetota bacterium]
MHDERTRPRCWNGWAGLVLLPAAHGGGETPFTRLVLAEEFTCEGASFADLDRDGHADVIAGPYWYRGPDFAQRREIYAPQAFDPKGYSDNFFAFPRDFDGDGWIDVLFVGFPGEAATWYANPHVGAEDTGRHWTKHVVVPHVDGESPEWADLTGDGVPELVFLAGGRLGWAGPEPGAPERPWTFHPLSEDLGLGRFTHGLGVGDVDGDGRADVLLKDGWWRQPESLAGDPVWERHPFVFSERHGGAQMLVTDVDGDGDGDVITSLAAHDFGLSCWEQVERDGARTFVEHRIMDDEPGDNPDGVKFGELHALALADVDGDGLQDVVTGKRWWSHGAQGDPDKGAVPAVVYAFLLRRPAPGQARFEARRLDDGSGVGTQVVAGDVTGDGRVDVVIGNKKGTYLLVQPAPGAPAPAQPPPRDAGELPTDGQGRPLNLDLERGTLEGWTAEGEAFAGQPVRGDAVAARGREPSRHAGEWWIGGYERHGDGPTGTLTSPPFRVTRRWASFLVGGGGGAGERVELCRLEADGSTTPFFRTSGASFESMQRVVVDLAAEQGRTLVVRLVDEETGGWGHLNFDDLRLHATRPSFPRPAGVPPILPPDPIVHAGLAPAAAAAAMTVPEGFAVDLIAAEPDLHQPIALAIDPHGRLWVAEAFTYPQRAPEGEGRDEIVVFEDRDHDGRFESRTVFARGLNLVSGLEVGFGGVWVGAAPYLLFLPDRNDDLVPDGPPEVLLDGWGYQDTHETLNAFTWGPDGWLYGCHGVFTHSQVGQPGASDAERTPINAGVWRYHPLRKEFEVFAWGTSNPWGVEFDAHGEAFVTACVIPHLYHLAQGGRYLRQAGRHFDAHAYADIDTIADHRHYLGEDPHGGNLRSNAAGGGHAHCGALLYQADAFPPEWRGRILMNNIHGNRVNADALVRSGSGYAGRHAEDLLLANDKWFRGIALRLGPEGSVYLIDWYDQQACHWTAPERWDRSNGRLYRIRHGEHVPQVVNLPALPSAELARLLFHANEWVARRARVLLQERGRDEQVAAALRPIARGGETPERALAALWGLSAVASFDEGLGRELLASPHAPVRAWSVRLLLERRQASPAVRADLAALAAREPEPSVRLALASGLQRLPVAQRAPLARALVAHGEDASDANLPVLLWYGIEPLAAEAPAEAFALLEETRIELLARFLVRRLAHEPAAQAELVRKITGEGDRRRHAWMVAELVGVVREQPGAKAPAGGAELVAHLRAEADASLRDQGLELALAWGDPASFEPVRALVEDAAADPERRRRALEALVRGKDARTGPVLLAALDDAALRAAAIRALAAFPELDAPAALLPRYAALEASERRDAVATLSARPEWARALLAAVGEGRVARGELSAFRLRALRQLDDPEIARLIEAHVGKVREGDAGKAEEIARVRALLETGGPPDLARGREVFQRTCQQCHTLFGTGAALGPDLTGSNRADREYLLETVIDPSAVVASEYQTTVARLLDGRLVTGIERARTASAVTIENENERVTLALAELEELELSPLSTMPEGLLDALAEDEVRALFAYVASPVQTPILTTPANAAGFFDGTLAGWRGDPGVWSAQGGELVGRTDGLAHNAFLRSEHVLSDFRLSLEVRLVGDQGNSGIQFRSAEVEGGDVAGYQADIGPGWWGKLYEEHGRALLVERGATQVVPDGWNRYVIECQGSHVRTWLNDEPCVDLDDPAGARSGIVALQVHSGGPTEVRFRNLRLELLPSK